MPAVADRLQTMKLVLAMIIILALLAGQSSAAASSPVTIQYGQSWPQSLVVDSSRGLVYIDAKSGIYPPTGFSFGVINATNHSLLRVLPLNETPGAMAYDQSRGDVYVAGTNSIGIFNGPNETFVRQIVAGRPVLFLAYDYRVSQNLYYTSGGRVFEIDPTTGAAIANATVGGEAGGLAIDPANGRLYVGNYILTAVDVFNASDLKPIGGISISSCCATRLALNNRTQTLYASTGTSTVDIFDARTDTYVKSASAASFSQNSTSYIAVDEGTGRVFVVTSPGGVTVELDSGGEVLGQFSLSSTPAGIAVDTKTGELYVSEYHGITIFDARSSITRDYTLAEVAALGAVLAVIGLVAIIRRRSWKDA